MTELNPTHDPQARSWVESANTAGTDFPIQNLAYCVVERHGLNRGGVAIGDQIFDLRAALQAGIFEGEVRALAELGARDTLNALMALPAAQASQLRAAVFAHLRADGPHRAQAASLAENTLIPMAHATLHLPCKVEGYTDFLTSIHHTERHGKFKGLKDPLPPAFKYLPVAYHGRTSSLRASGPDVIRPNGQWKDAASGEVRFGPIAAMDFELELGAWVAQGNRQGLPIHIERAAEHLFGFSLLNDWSAKSLQWWEQVLGPFLGKNFHTSVSPWVVTAEALAPFRARPAPRAANDPALLPHLHGESDQRSGALDVELQAWISTEKMRRDGDHACCITRTNPRSLYWTFAQMLTHHASNGCNLQPGDLIGSGTISGEDRSAMACMTEMTEAGRQPITLDNGEQRLWLEDGDEIILSGQARRDGFVSIGFGQCRGRIAAARPWPAA